MLRRLVGDECDGIGFKLLVSVGKRATVILSEAKNLEAIKVLRDSSSLCSSE